MVVSSDAYHRLLAPAERSAAELFDRLGPWAGETTDEILAILADARRKSSQREVSDL